MDGLELPNCLHQQIICHLNVAIHCRFNIYAAQRIPWHFRRHFSLDCAGSICVPEDMHTKPFDARRVAQFIKVRPLVI